MFQSMMLSTLRSMGSSVIKSNKPMGLFKSITYTFSTEQPTTQPTTKKPRQSRRQQQTTQNDFSVIDYYRNTIRKVNIRSNGKGRFSAYNLQKIIGMTQTQQHAKVMYQAYYNYLGHFTLIPNKVVDQLVMRSIKIGNLSDRLIEIFSNHNYLTYFPHYSATNAFVRHLLENGDQENLEKMLRVLISHPLIKINYKTVSLFVENLGKEEVDATIKEYMLKILVFRRKLVHGINQEDLLAKVAQVLKNNQLGPFQGKPMVRNALTQLLIDEPIVSQEDSSNRLILASTFSMINECGEFLSKQQEQITNQYNDFLDYLLPLYQRSSQQTNYGTALKETLAQAKLSVQASEKLQKLQKGE